MSADDVKRLTAPQTGDAATLAGCIDYAFAGEVRRHQTRYVYEVDRKGPDNKIVPTDGDLPADAVILNLNPLLAGNPD
jgi:hypothetical protein